MSKEIDQIKRNAELDALSLRVHKGLAELGDRDPDKNVKFENLSDKNLQWWLDFSIEHEYFNYAATLKKEQEKRKSY